MNYNTDDFTKELKEFIDKEKESNKVIKADVISINRDVIEVSTKYNTDLTKNMVVEVDRIPARIINKNNKNIQIKTLKKNYFKSNQSISIKNIQKDIIIHKLQETLDNILENKINTDNKKTLDVIVNEHEISFFGETPKISSKLNLKQFIKIVK